MANPQSANPTSGILARALRVLRPSHEHSAFSATLLLMSAVMASRVFGLLRETYVAWAFGATGQTDAYNAAFTLPDYLNYLLAGGTASITFISIYSRFLSQKRDEEANRTFSVIITVMSSVLIAGIALAEIFARPIVHKLFPGFTPEAQQLCTQLTRILLPAQLFFYVGAVASAVLMARRLFLIPALAPLFYNIGIIGGGIFLSRHLGIASLAIGAVAGALLGPFLINVVGAARTPIRYFPSFDLRNAAFREWLRLSVPLMLGVSLVTADEWIQRYFASHGIGDITRLNYARRLFLVPIAVIGQAAGQASLPFFSRLFNEKRMEEFAATVSASIYRISVVSVLASAWMMATALPVIDLVLRRGRFHFSDARETAPFFFVFAISLAFWSAQAIYARAFYGASNTLTPMVASTIITAASIPVYAALYHTLSIIGLVIASDIGIVVNTLGLAVLLHRRGIVPAGMLNWKELGKATAVAVFAGVLSSRVAGFIAVNGTYVADLKAIALASITWAAAVALGLWFTGSELPANLRRRRGAARSPANAGPLAAKAER